MQRIVDTLHDILDKYTKEPVTYDKVTLYHDGTDMDDSKVDNILYKKLTTDGVVEYFKRNIYGFINARWFGILPTNSASVNNTAITKMIASVPASSTIYFPNGTYQFSLTTTISKTLNFVGESKMGTILKNIGASVNAFHINDNVERGWFKNIAIFGDGTSPFGTDASTGKGFTFGANSIHWNFDNVWMRGHGDHFFYADGTGSVNNINITNSEFEYGKKSAIHFVQSDFSNQINAIHIVGCNFSGFAENNLELWGQSITVENNTIQASKKRGISIDASFGTSPSSAVGIRLLNNYFELCNQGNIYAKAFVDNSGNYRYIADLTIMGNYGTYSPIPGDTVDTTLYAACEIDAPSFYSQDNIQFSALLYLNNAFVLGQASKAVLDCHNVLTDNSFIQKSVTSSGDFNKYINLGRATILGQAFPHITTTERNEISSPNLGDVIFNVTTGYIESYTGSVWKPIGDKPSQWLSSVSDAQNPKVTFNGEVEINSASGDTLSIVTSAGKYTLNANTLSAPGAFQIRAQNGGYLVVKDDYANLTIANGEIALNQTTGTPTSWTLGDGIAKLDIGGSEFVRFTGGAANFGSKNIIAGPATLSTHLATKGQLDAEIGKTYTIAQLRTADTVSGKSYSISDFDGGTFIDRGLNDGVHTDDGAINIISANGHWLERVFTGAVNVKWFNLPSGNTTDYAPAINNAIDAASVSESKTLSLVGQGYYVDTSIVVKSNVKIIFEQGAFVKKLPDSTGSYEIFSLNGVENVEIVNPVIIGDNDEHIGTTGEFGMGIYAVNSQNITVRNANISKCWGDGIYIGSIGSDKTIWNKNLQFLGKTIITDCRRQAVSVICGYDIYFEYLYGKDIEGTAPSATIDFEPNNATQDITFRAGTIEGINTDAALLFVHLGGDYDINIGKVIDTRSRHNSGDGGFLFLGGATAIKNTGAINIGEIISDSVAGKPLFLFDDWYSTSSPKVTIGKYTLGTWDNTGITSDYKYSVVNHFVSTSDDAQSHIGNFTIGELTIDSVIGESGKVFRPYYIAGSTAVDKITLTDTLINYKKLPSGVVFSDGQSVFKADDSVIITQPLNRIKLIERKSASFSPEDGKQYIVTTSVALDLVLSGFNSCILYGLSDTASTVYLVSNTANSRLTTFIYDNGGTIDTTGGIPYFLLNPGDKVILERQNLSELHVKLVEKTYIPDITGTLVKNNSTDTSQGASFNINGRGAMKVLDLPTNDNYAFATTKSYPSVYSSGALGSAYPFLDAGNLVIQSRANADRDIVFVTGSTPSVKAKLNGTSGNFDVVGRVSAADAISGTDLATLGQNNNLYISKGNLSAKTISDGDAVNEVGYFYLNGANQPAGTTDGALLNAQYNSSYQAQMFLDWRTGGVYARGKGGSTFTPWRDLAFNDEVKFRTPVSVRDFGAVGNNIADDTDEIQAAFGDNAVTVILERGKTYKTSAPIRLTKDQTLDFNGAIIESTSTTSIIAGRDDLLNGAYQHDHAKILNAIIKSGTAKTGIDLKGFKQSLIVNPRIELTNADSTTVGINFRHGSLGYEQCYFNKVLSPSIYLDGPGTGILFSGVDGVSGANVNTVEGGAVIGSDKYGVRMINSSTGNVISNLDCEHYNPSVDTIGFLIETSGNTFIGTHVENYITCMEFTSTAHGNTVINLTAAVYTTFISNVSDHNIFIGGNGGGSAGISIGSDNEIGNYTKFRIAGTQYPSIRIDSKSTSADSRNWALRAGFDGNEFDFTRSNAKAGDPVSAGTAMWSVNPQGHFVLPNNIKVAGRPTYANNAAAVADGWGVGFEYQTSTGEVRVVV